MSAVDLAEEALARHDGLTGLARATDTSSRRSPGRPGAGRPAEAAFELGRRLLADWPSGRWTIRSPRDVAERLILADGPARARGAAGGPAQHQERRPARGHGLPGQRQLAPGPGRRAVPRRRPAQCLRRDPVHNHPSGDPTPRPDDLHLTAEALAAGRLLDIECSTTWSSATTPSSRCVSGAWRSVDRPACQARPPGPAG